MNLSSILSKAALLARTRICLALLASAAIVVPAAAARAHFHISVGVSQGQLAMTTYGTAANGLAVHFDPVTGLLVDSNNATVPDIVLTSFSATGVGAAGPTGGFISSPVYYGAAFTLTTDYYTSSETPGFATSDGSNYDPSKDPLGDTGTLPDIIYKLMGFTLAGGDPTNALAYDVRVNATGEPQHQDAYAAMAGAYAGLGQTLDYGYGNHIHGVTMYSLQPGVYNLEIVAHDATGQFSDSKPAFVQIEVPEPGTVGMVVAGLGLVMRAARRRS